MTAYRRPLLLAVSDATGETAQQVCRAALAQFGHFHETSVRTVPHVLDEHALEATVLQAKRTNALLVYTLVGPELRARVKELADEHDVEAVDLLGSLIGRIGQHVGKSPLSVPGLGHELDEDYFRRIEAIEFAVKHDDGRGLSNLKNAEIVIVGISRTSKTPLSNYIAHRGLRVANIPLVLGLPLPAELDGVDPARVFGLTIEPGVLSKIRRHRVTALRMDAGNAYGDPLQIRKEVRWAAEVFAAHPEWSVIDVTRRAIEETAAQIVEAYRSRFGPSARRRKRAKRARR